jgi:hypothetical protein
MAGAQEKSPQAELQRGAELARAERLEEAVGVWLAILEGLQGTDLATANKYLGVAYKRLEMWPEAWHHLTAYLATSGRTDPDAGAMLQTVEERLRQSFVKVALACDPPGLLVTIPPSKAGFLHQSAIRNPQSAIVWWFLPGKHTVHAELAGYVAQDVVIDVRERGDSGQRDIRLAAVPPPVEVGAGGGKKKPGEVPVTVEKPVEPSRGSRTLEWVLLGSGVALGVTGGILQGIGYSRNEELHDDYQKKTGEDAQSQYDDAYADEVRPKEISAYVLYGVGGAAVVTSVVLWLARKPEAKETHSGAKVEVVPMGLPGGGGAMMSLEW